MGTDRQLAENRLAGTVGFIDTGCSKRFPVMPLVGTIDTERAKLIMENLLEGVVKQRAEVVLLDITGVPVVDTMVAHHIIQAADAVRLVGAKCMLVGIRPEIAQTIVTLRY